MQKTIHSKSSQTTMISRALNRPARVGDVTFECIGDAFDSNLNLVEQLQRMQWIVMESARILGNLASPKEYEEFLNRALRRVGIVDVRAIVALSYDEF
jgi:hypothetical protein